MLSWFVDEDEEAEDVHPQEPKAGSFNWGASLAPVKNTFIHYDATAWFSSLHGARRRGASSPAVLTDASTEPSRLAYGLPVCSVPPRDAVLPPTIGAEARKAWADELDEDSKDFLWQDATADSGEALTSSSTVSTRPSFGRRQGVASVPEEGTSRGSTALKQGLLPGTAQEVWTSLPRATSWLSMKSSTVASESDDDVLPRAVSFQMPKSREEKLLAHERGECKPCAYLYAKEDGCRQGDDCEFCHECGPEEVKERKRAQKRKSRTARRVAISLSKAESATADNEGAVE